VIPKRLFARVARYSDAIHMARLSGLTWAEISAVLTEAIGHTKPRSLANAFAVARRLAKEGIIAVDQLPLPISQVQASDLARMEHSACISPAQKKSSSTQEPHNFINLDS